jgi:quercetin dioxygenase-like cupin family protein
VSNEKNKSGLESAKVYKLEKLVEISEGAVVSRILIKKKTGTVTLFAFDEGQALSEHTAPFDALVTIFDGEAEWTIGGKAVTLTSGESILMPAKVPHAVRAIRPFKMLLTMIRE